MKSIYVHVFMHTGHTCVHQIHSLNKLKKKKKKNSFLRNKPISGCKTTIHWPHMEYPETRTACIWQVTPRQGADIMCAVSNTPFLRVF